MAKYEITSPSGERFEITAPDDATDDQVMAYAQSQWAAKPAAEEPKYDPTEGMSGFEKFVAGYGKAMPDLFRGTGQLFGLVDSKDIAESQKNDEPLMRTGAGLAGNIAGNVAAFAPAMFIPGANTVAGASAIGAATGLLAPTADENVIAGKAKSSLLGGLLGGGSVLAGRAIHAGVNAGKSLLEPFTKAGQESIAGRALQQFATNADDASVAAANAVPPVPGYQPMLAEATQDPGLATLQRAIGNTEASAQLGAREMDNAAALKAAIKNIAGDDAAMAAARESRDSAANTLYGKAFESDAMRRDLARQVVKQQADTMTGGLNIGRATAESAAQLSDDLSTPGLRELAKRPAFQSAVKQAKDLAANKGIAMDDPLSSLEGLHYVKLAMDDMLDGEAGSALGRNAKSSLASMKSKLIDEIEEIAPSYGAARKTFQQMSQPINQMEIGRALYNKLAPALDDLAATPGLKSASYAEALRNADRTVKTSTGMRMPLDQIMSPEQMGTINSVGETLALRASAQSMARPAGTNTAQNLASQNLIRRIAGPLGAPQSWAEARVLPTLMRPVNFAMQGQEPAINQVLAEAMTNPKFAAELMKRVSKPDRFGLLVDRVQRTALPGLLGANTAQK